MESSIGDAAGIVWRYLDEHGNSAFTKLKRGTKLSDQELCMAIGWLAREGQIAIAQEKRSLVVALRR